MDGPEKDINYLALQDSSCPHVPLPPPLLPPAPPPPRRAPPPPRPPPPPLQPPPPSPPPLPLSRRLGRPRTRLVLAAPLSRAKSREAGVAAMAAAAAAAVQHRR